VPHSLAKGKAAARGEQPKRTEISREWIACSSVMLR
jgi:hypothetical protein